MSGRFLRFAVLIVLLLLTAQVAQPYITRLMFAATTPRLVVPRGSLSEAERATIALFEQVSPSPRASSGWAAIQRKHVG
jgi:2-alkenal reductase